MRPALLLFTIPSGCGAFDFGPPPAGSPPPSPPSCSSYVDASSCAAAGCDALACETCAGPSFTGCYDPGAAPDCEPVQCGGGGVVGVTCDGLDGSACGSTPGCAVILDENDGFLSCTQAGISCVTDPADAGCDGSYPACDDGYAYALDDNGCPAGCVDPATCSAQD